MDEQDRPASLCRSCAKARTRQIAVFDSGKEEPVLTPVTRLERRCKPWGAENGRVVMGCDDYEPEVATMPDFSKVPIAAKQEPTGEPIVNTEQGAEIPVPKRKK